MVDHVALRLRCRCSPVCIWPCAAAVLGGGSAGSGGRLAGGVPGHQQRSDRSQAGPIAREPLPLSAVPTSVPQPLYFMMLPQCLLPRDAT